MREPKTTPAPAAAAPPPPPPPLLLLLLIFLQLPRPPPPPRAPQDRKFGLVLTLLHLLPIVLDSPTL